MSSDLRRQVVTDSAVSSAEHIVSSARLGELHDCSVLLRRTRMRAEEIVDEARAMLAEAERVGDLARVPSLTAQLREARAAYCKVLNAYVIICRRINEERRSIVQDMVEGRHDLRTPHVA